MIESSYIEVNGYIMDKAIVEDGEHIVNNLYLYDEELYLGCSVECDLESYSWEEGFDYIEKINDIDRTGVRSIIIHPADNILGMIVMDDGTHHVIKLDNNYEYIKFVLPDVEFTRILYDDNYDAVLQSDTVTLKLDIEDQLIFYYENVNDIETDVPMFSVNPEQLDILRVRNLIGKYCIIGEYIIKNEFILDSNLIPVISRDEIAYFPITRLEDRTWNEEELVRAIESYEEPVKVGPIANIIKVKEHSEVEWLTKYSVQTTEGIYILPSLEFFSDATYIGDTEYIKYGNLYLYISPDEIIKFRPPCEPVANRFSLICDDIVITGSKVKHRVTKETIGNITMYQVFEHSAKSASKKT